MEEQRHDGVGTDPTARPEGVAPDGEATATEQGVGTEDQGPTAEGAEPQPERQAINLDDVPEFRQWKSNYDRKMAQIQKEAQEARQRAAQLEEQFDELRARDMPPDERAEYYRTRLAKVEADRQRQQEEATRQQELVGDAMKTLEQLGLDPETPGLEWGDKPTPENLARLYRSAARIVAERTRQVSQSAQQKVQDEVREARIEALNAAGVTRTSTATSGAPPTENPIEKITDPIELIKMGTEAQVRDRQGRQPPRG